MRTIFPGDSGEFSFITFTYKFKKNRIGSELINEFEGYRNQAKSYRRHETLYETDWRDAPSTRDLHVPATETEVARIPLDSFGRIRFEIVEFRNIRFCHTPLATFTPN